MRLLTGLYEPSAGMILWDGKAVERSNRGDYRQLFSCVFTDFHLFDRLYGAADLDPALVNKMIADMELAEKTTYRDGHFTHLDLSTGQRKRLALIVALVEDRPIYLLDEVGADQDPAFRQRFYREILPGLRQRGKAVIVISHDDRYFDVGDRVLTMRDGRLAQAEAAP
jgi:putative ATP-binding cassette transporter